MTTCPCSRAASVTYHTPTPGVAPGWATETSLSSEGPSLATCGFLEGVPFPGGGQGWVDEVGDLGAGRGVAAILRNAGTVTWGWGGAGLGTQVSGDNGRCPVPPHTFSGVVAPSGEAPARRDHSLSCQDTDLMVAGC